VQAGGQAAGGGHLRADHGRGGGAWQGGAAGRRDDAAGSVFGVRPPVGHQGVHD